MRRTKLAEEVHQSITSATIGLKGLAGTMDGDDEHDDGSFAFSLAMTPTLAKLYVHWDGVSPDGKPAYHMHSIGSYVLGKKTVIRDSERPSTTT